MLKRELYLSRIREFYDSNLIKILVGIRRCGKSIILQQIIKGYDVYTVKTKKGEIDFVAIKPNKKIYLQVAFSIPNEKTKNREFGAYKSVNDSYPKYVITLDKLTYEYD